MSKRIAPKILYADDDIDDIYFVKDSFDRLDVEFDIVTFLDGYDLIKYLSNLPEEVADPCLIIIDMNMPKYDGRRTVSAIRAMERYKDVPLIIFTTSSYVRDIEFAKQNNVGFVTKPIDDRQLLKITETFIDHCSDTIKSYYRQ